MSDKKLEPAACAKSVSGSGGPWRPVREMVLSLPIAGRPSLHRAITGLPGRQRQGACGERAATPGWHAVSVAASLMTSEHHSPSAVTEFAAEPNYVSADKIMPVNKPLGTHFGCDRIAVPDLVLSAAAP
jgi:hypothetical protein